MATLDDYPDTSSHTGRTGMCQKSGWTAEVCITDYDYVVEACSDPPYTCNNQYTLEDDMAAGIKSTGPASICVYADWGWQDYQSGVISNNRLCKYGYDDLDH